MKIGLFLGYGPGTRLRKEGLGRYLANIIRIFGLSGDELFIACPDWLKADLEDLIKDTGVASNISFVNSKTGVPIAIRVYMLLKKRKKRTRIQVALIIKFLDFVFSKSIALLSKSSILSLILALICFIIGIVLSIPIVFVAAVGLVIFYFLKKCNGIRSIIAVHLRKIVKKAYSKSNIIKNDYFSDLYNASMKSARMELVKLVNKKHLNVDLWYSPSAFWPEFNEIKGSRIMNVPDVVTQEFPFQWGADSLIKLTTDECRDAIRGGDYFIVYSEFLKKSLLERVFKKCSEHIFVIPHGINDLHRSIKLNNSQFTGEELLLWENSICREIMNGARNKVINESNYAANFEMASAKYIFYATQYRPHKNILNLVKAYEYLLRRKHLNIKLFLTCDFSQDEELLLYIQKHRLQYDVLSFFNLSSKELAAFYHEAELVVNPSLYEGGFPFTFGEGMSVGVPSVMSNISQVEEFTGNYGMDEALFDPYDYLDMARTIENALNSRKHMLEIELPLFNYISDEFSDKRNANRFVEAFKACMNN